MEKGCRHAQRNSFGNKSKVLFVHRDDHFYLFDLFKALYIKLVKTSKYGRNILRFLLKN